MEDDHSNISLDISSDEGPEQEFILLLRIKPVKKADIPENEVTVIRFMLDEVLPFAVHQKSFEIRTQQIRQENNTE